MPPLVLFGYAKIRKLRANGFLGEIFALSTAGCRILLQGQKTEIYT